MMLLLTIGLGLVFAAILEIVNRRLVGYWRRAVFACLVGVGYAIFHLVHYRLLRAGLALALPFNLLLGSSWPHKEPKRITARDLRLDAKPVDEGAWPPSPSTVGQYDAAITGIVFRGDSSMGMTVEEIAKQLAVDSGLGNEDALFAVREYAGRRVRRPIAFEPYAYFVLVLLTLCIAFILRYVVQTSIAVASIFGAAILFAVMSIALWIAIVDRRRRR